MNKIFSKEEQQLNLKLEELFNKWYNVLEKNGATKEELELWCYDGFFPGYLKQKTRVLIIGRECRGLGGESFIEMMLEGFSKNEIGVKNGRTMTINQHPMHSKAFYLVYGLNNNFIPYTQMPWASEMLEYFGTEKGISYAFMNISKFSNESDNYKTNYVNVNRFIELSKSAENLFWEEIELLNPDVILTMNLQDKIQELAPNVESIDADDDVHMYEIGCKSKKIKLYDLWHFSGPKKKKNKKKIIEGYYYTPLKEMMIQHKHNLR